LREKNIKKEEKELNDKLEELKKDLKGSVFGFFHELVTPIKDKYDLPIQIALKSRLNLFVIDTQSTAIKVDKFLS
jgi:chromosome segregation ATPase